jgi:hypothetical protein
VTIIGSKNICNTIKYDHIVGKTKIVSSKLTMYNEPNHFNSVLTYNMIIGIARRKKVTMMNGVMREIQSNKKIATIATHSHLSGFK